MRIRFVASLAAAVAVGFAVTGCERAAARDEAWAPKTVAADRLSAELAALPLAGYRLTGKEAVLQARATDVLTRRCMQRYGLTVAGTSEEDLKQLETTVDSQDLVGIGLVDEDEAARYGYHGRPGDAGAEGADRASATPALTAEQQQVLFGAVATFAGQPVPKGGCRLETTRALVPASSSARHNSPPPNAARAGADTGATDGTATVNLQLAARDSINVVQRIKADDHYADMVSAWHDCMDKDGFAYDSPYAVAEYFSNKNLGQDEVKTAVADVRCKAKVNYLGVYLALARKYQQAALDSREVEYREVLKAKRAMLAKAAQVLAG